MADAPAGEAYRIHVWIRQISPMIWRRLLVGSDSSIADLHHTLQIAFGWSDSHLHRFHIHGRDYGIGKIGGTGFSTDAKEVRLADFRFRINGVTREFGLYSTLSPGVRFGYTLL